MGKKTTINDNLHGQIIMEGTYCMYCMYCMYYVNTFAWFNALMIIVGYSYHPFLRAVLHHRYHHINTTLLIHHIILSHPLTIYHHPSHQACVKRSWTLENSNG